MERTPRVGRVGPARLRNPQDLAAGLFFLAVGAFALWIAQDYPVGTRGRLGTGAFPRMLSWGLIGIGAAIVVEALFTAGPRLTAWALRPFVFVLLAIVAFAFLLEPAGLVIATAALLLIAAIGSPDTRWREAILFTLFIAALGVAVFVWGLGLPLRVLPL